MDKKGEGSMWLDLTLNVAHRGKLLDPTIVHEVHILLGF